MALSTADADAIRAAYTARAPALAALLADADAGVDAVEEARFSALCEDAAEEVERSFYGNRWPVAVALLVAHRITASAGPSACIDASGSTVYSQSLAAMTRATGRRRAWSGVGR